MGTAVFKGLFALRRVLMSYLSRLSVAVSARIRVCITYSRFRFASFGTQRRQAKFGSYGGPRPDPPQRDSFCLFGVRQYRVQSAVPESGLLNLV